MAEVGVPLPLLGFGMSGCVWSRTVQVHGHAQAKRQSDARFLASENLTEVNMLSSVLRCCRPTTKAQNLTWATVYSSRPNERT